MAEALHPETRDVWPRALLLFGVGLLVFLALAAVALWLIFDTTPFWPLANTEMNENEASPALHRMPETDLAAFRKQEDEDLGRLAWIDREPGIARIPIEDAMKLVAAHGLPQWAPQSVRTGEDCALLEAQVPRAPQVRKCRTAAGQAPSPAPSPDHPAPAGGARP